MEENNTLSGIMNEFEMTLTVSEEKLYGHSHRKRGQKRGVNRSWRREKSNGSLQ